MAAHEEEEENPFDVDDDWADLQGAGSVPAGAGGAEEDELWADPDWANDEATTAGDTRVQSAPSTSDEGNATPAAPALSSGGSPKNSQQGGAPPEQQVAQQDAPEASVTPAPPQRAEERKCAKPWQPPVPAESPPPPPQPDVAPELGQAEAVEQEQEARSEQQPAESAEPLAVEQPTSPPPPHEDGGAPAPLHEAADAPVQQVQAAEQQEELQQELLQQEPLLHSPAVAPKIEAEQQVPNEDMPIAPPAPATASRESQDQEGARGSGSGGGGGAAQPWGWSGGWSLNALGGTLRAVAAGAVRDVRELTGSLHQALAEVQDGDEEEEQLDGGKASRAAAATPAQEQQQPRLPVHQEEEGEGAGANEDAGAPAPAKRAGALEDGMAAEQPTPAAPGEGTAAAAALASRPPQVQPGAETDVAAAAEEGQEGGDASGEASGLSDLDEVDQRMEQLATGAVKALSNLWGGLSGVARNTATLVSKVEAVTLDLAKDLVSGAGVTQDVQQLQSAAVTGVRGVAAIGTRIEAGLETVGRTALGLLEEVTGQHHRATLSAGAASGGADGLAAGAPRQGTQRTFEELYYLYGGQQLSEDLENLANECARIANKARARLEEGQQAELDKTTALLGPLFSSALLASSSAAFTSAPPAATSAASPEQDADADDAWLAQDEAARLALEQLDQRYEPVRFLCQDSAQRAQGFRELLLAAAREQQEEEQKQQVTISSTAPAANAAEAGDASGQAGAVTKGDVAGQGADGVAVEQVGASAAGEAQQEGAASGTNNAEGGEEGTEESLLRAALLQVRGHAFKRMAELTTAQLQLLLDHGVNLAAPARTTDNPAGSSIAWPETALPQARLLQRQARHMARDMDAVSHFYATALQAALDQAAAAAPTQGQEDSSQQGQDGAVPEAVAAAGEVEKQQQQQQQQQGGSQLARDLEVCRQALQQLRLARGMACGALEEAFRGLLYPVLVRELVQRIAGSADDS